MFTAKTVSHLLRKIALKSITLDKLTHSFLSSTTFVTFSTQLVKTKLNISDLEAYLIYIFFYCTYFGQNVLIHFFVSVHELFNTSKYILDRNMYIILSNATYDFNSTVLRRLGSAYHFLDSHTGRSKNIHNQIHFRTASANI